MFFNTIERGVCAVPVSKSQTRYTIFFMIALSFICALILSLLASALAKPQEIAKDLDRSKEMLISAQILNAVGYFQVRGQDGNYLPAKAQPGGWLKPSSQKVVASDSNVLAVYKTRITPFLVNEKGEESTFEKTGIGQAKYLADYKKSGYYHQPWKLIYKIFANPTKEEIEKNKKTKVEGYVIPVNGMGLWDAIYGYLAIRTDGNTVIGISWYDQKETPGLGANISEPEWQSQFPGKHIFQENADGKTNFESAQLGITVVKGKVSEVLGNSPKAKSAVDGMAGATLTGNGVTDAYKDVLAAYRPFLMQVHQENETDKK